MSLLGKKGADAEIITAELVGSNPGCPIIVQQISGYMPSAITSLENTNVVNVDTF